MDGYQGFLFFIAAIYLMECVAWVREGEVLFSSWWGGPARVAGPGFHLKNPVPLGLACRGAGGASWDVKAVARRREFFLERTGTLQVVMVFLFLMPWLGMGLFFWNRYLYAAWFGLGLLALALHASAAPLFYRAHKALYPALASDRAFQTFLCALSPFQSARAADLLARDLFVDADPLAAAAVLCAPEDFRGLALRRWRELRFPAGGGTDSSGDGLARWLKERGVDVSAPGIPRRSDPASAFYCERCGSDYVAGRERCVPCDRPLVPFPA